MGGEQMNKYKELRINIGLTRKEASEKLGISWYHLRNIENNQRIPGRNVIIKMSSLYKCTINELFSL